MLNAQAIVSLVDNPCNPDSRVMRISETLAEAGHRVTVVCKLAPGLAADEHINGVHYVRVPMCARPLRPRSGLFKFSAFESFVAETVLTLRPTILHANDLIALPAATRLASRLGGKVVYDVHDLYLHGPKRRSRLAYWHGEKMERTGIQRADAVITVSNGLADHLRDAYGIKRPVVIMNAPKLDRPLKGNRCLQLRDDLNLCRQVPLGVYLGARSKSRGLDRLVRAMGMAPDIHIAMIGHAQSIDNAELLRIAEEGGYAERLHLLPPVPHSSVTHYIADADFGVLPYHVDCLNHEYSMPNKLFESVFAGLPVAVSKLHEVQRFVEATKAGVIMNALDVEDIARALRTLAWRRNEMRLGTETVSALISSYGWPFQAKILLDVYAGLRQ